MFYSIRDEELPNGYPATFTAKHFNLENPEPDWYKTDEGIHTTECDGKSIQIEVIKI